MRYWVIAFWLTIAAQIAHAAGATDDLIAGKELYTAKCARCHKFYDPAKYNAESWNAWMEKMRRKAKLSDEQYKHLSEYLQSVRSDVPRKTDAEAK